MSLAPTKAARTQLLLELLNPPIYDDDGKLVGHGEPLLTREQVLELLAEA